MLETVSEKIHDLWVEWAKTLMEGEPSISEERRKRWQECFVPYAELSEEMKELDRKFARLILASMPITGEKPCGYLVTYPINDKVSEERLFLKHNEARAYQIEIDENGWMDSEMFPLFLRFTHETWQQSINVGELTETIFMGIKHGDEEHQAWLKRELGAIVEKALKS